MNRRDKDPLCGLTARDGLNRLREKWGQKLYMRAQCEYLVEDGNIETAIRCTEVPERRQSYELNRKSIEKIGPTQRERHWEQAIFQRWRAGDDCSVAGCWSRVLSYQTPLFSDQMKSGWGYIDLLGVEMASGTATPIVIELKKEPSQNAKGGYENSETPLAILLQAMAYAEAIRRNWKRQFRREFVEHVAKVNGKVKVPEELKKIHLVAAAPQGYWIHWVPLSPKGLKIEPETWKAFRKLLTALDTVGRPASFVSILGSPDKPKKLQARPLRGFPLG